MFRDPLLQLGARLLAGQRSGLDLRPGGLTLLGELPGKGRMLRRRIGTDPGPEAGAGAKLHPGTLSALEGPKLSHAAGGHHLPTTGSGEPGSAADADRTAHRHSTLHSTTLHGTTLHGTTLLAAELTHLLRTRHRKAVHVEALDLARLEAGDVVDSS